MDPVYQQIDSLTETVLQYARALGLLYAEKEILHDFKGKLLFIYKPSRIIIWL